MTTAATEVKERPIIFSGPMVKAILDGRKSQTRRVIKLDKYSNWQVLPESSNGTGACVLAGSRDLTTWIECPYGQIGDRLWVKENALPDFPKAFSYYDWTWAEVPEEYRSPEYVLYRADGRHEDVKMHPSIFMPRWASRITLEIVNVRVERLQEISERDAYLEGIPLVISNEDNYITPQSRYKDLWESINAKKYPWASNPWVWVVEFKKVV
jgi:hypothetical protein